MLQPRERHKHIERRHRTGPQTEVGQFGIRTGHFGDSERQPRGEVFGHRERRVARQYAGLGDAQPEFIARFEAELRGEARIDERFAII